MTEFQPWPKIPRLFNQPNAQNSRAMTVTEKIDGTNGALVIYPSDPWLDDVRVPAISVRVNGELSWLSVQSRKRFLTPEQDNFGFATWAWENAQEITDALGYGTHFGEWWGKGIQRGYAQDRKHFSLFNAGRWDREGMLRETEGLLDVVPILFTSDIFDTSYVRSAIDQLTQWGSVASPGFMKPEGVVVYHHPSGQSFKAFVDEREKELERLERAYEQLAACLREQEDEAVL